jgi:ATP-dependent RNA helicase DeaD
VRCNDASEGGKGVKAHKTQTHKPQKPNKPQKPHQKEDWMQFLNPKGMKLKGEIPDFEEEGWAIRKPRKKK